MSKCHRLEPRPDRGPGLQSRAPARVPCGVFTQQPARTASRLSSSSLLRAPEASCLTLQALALSRLLLRSSGSLSRAPSGSGRFCIRSIPHRSDFQPGLFLLEFSPDRHPVSYPASFRRASVHLIRKAPLAHRVREPPVVMSLTLN